jgi:hypothetical protein
VEIPNAPRAVAALAGFLRDRLDEVTATLAPLWARREDSALEHTAVASARQLTMVIVAATAPLARTSYSRARLIRQMHASGLLTDEHVRRAGALLEVEDGSSGAPQ